MNREKFLSILEIADLIVATFYNEDEINCRIKMAVGSFEEYDDEIIIRGEVNDFLILKTDNIEISMDEYGNSEFLFTTGNQKIGVEFPA